MVHGSAPDRLSLHLGVKLSAPQDGILSLSATSEPSLPQLEEALDIARPHVPHWVLAIGGGSVLDMGKALAALIPATGSPMDHLEGRGRGLPLALPPLPFIAVPTTAGTGAEVTKNAVIALPEFGLKVSLRDDRMIPRLAIVDPALTDHCPKAVTLASGLDALTQVIESYVSCKATPYSDAISRPAIAPGLAALMRLMKGEEPKARDEMAWTSLCGGLALANAGLGAVHGLAGVIGGRTGAAHGAICGALLGPILAMNLKITEGLAQSRLQEVCGLLAGVLGCSAEEAPQWLTDWARAEGLARLTELGVRPKDHAEIIAAALQASSMKSNPVQPSAEALSLALSQA